MYNNILGTENLQNYFSLMRKYKPLSDERLKEIDERLKDKNISTIEKNKLHEELILSNLRYVISLAKKYQFHNVDIMDLVSEGNIGLIKSVEKYDPNKENKFITHAVWWIRQSIISFLYNHSRMIRLPTNIIQEHSKAQKYLNEHDDEISELLTTISYDNELSFHLLDILGYEDENEIFKTDFREKINKLLTILDDREKYIITSYYGLDGTEINLDVISENLNLSKERTRQIKETAIKKIRNESYSILKNGIY